MCLATVLVSDDPRDYSNARRKHVQATAAGMQFRHLQFSANATQDQVERGADDLANDPAVHGIFVQLPLPAQLQADAILRRIPPNRNVDGPVPATPAGILRVLELYEIPVTGVRAVVVGRSPDIARPLARLFEERNDDVTLVDADAPSLGDVTRSADILASAAERFGLITGAHVKAGATVVDAGYNRIAGGVGGDVELESVERVASAILPMPGGIGPATIAMLLERTWNNAR